MVFAALRVNQGVIGIADSEGYGSHGLGSFKVKFYIVRYNYSLCSVAEHSLQDKDTFAFAQAFMPQSGQVYFVLLAAFFFALSLSVVHNST